MKGTQSNAEGIPTTVIPSEAEGYRHETFKVTQRDPSTVARDDDVLKRK